MATKDETAEKVTEQAAAAAVKDDAQQPVAEAATATVEAPMADFLDGLEDVEFLLEEIEDKIAPLAL